ncbi:MAG: RNA polymerase-binding protein DksA [Nitrospira sp.]|nr:RNA polymerase-binding protein DksA [Nitrospira sp.]
MKKKQSTKHTIKKVTTTKAKTNIQSKSKTKKSAPISLREKKLREIKKKLLAQKKALLTEAIEALQELPGQITFPDLGDQATAETDRNFMLRLRGRERSLLRKIDNALERIEQGIFGICERCKEDIGIKRLEARPVTTLCIECKMQQEEEEKLMGT